LKTIGEDDPAKVRVRIQKEYESLLSQVNEQEQVVRSLRGGLVNSDQITVLLARLLEQSQGVSLLSIENAGVTPVNATAVSKGVASTYPPPPGAAGGISGGTPLLQVPPSLPAATTGPTLYRHGVRMLLKGDYRSLVRYLAHVEQLPWTIYWDEVTLVVDKHPVVELAIEFHTLSEQEAWLEIT
jgi:MSHA biogenesis protein MshJ